MLRTLNSVVGDASTNSENKNGVAEAVAPVPLIQLMRAIGSVKERGIVKVSVVLPFTPGHPPWLKVRSRGEAQERKQEEKTA